MKANVTRVSGAVGRVVSGGYGERGRGRLCKALQAMIRNSDTISNAVEAIEMF